MTTNSTLSSTVYATLQQLTERYGDADLRQITDATAQSLDVRRAETALQDASQEIEAYIGQRYMLPLVDANDTPLAAPHALVRCVCDIAIYRLQTLRNSDDIKDARRRYEDVLKMLANIASGDLLLPLAKRRPDAPVGGAAGDNQPVGAAQFNTPDSSPFSPFARGER